MSDRRLVVAPTQPGRVIRLRTIHTNPIELPSRFLPQATGSAERFAKCATVVAKLYSLHLDAGAPLVAKTSWASFIPTDMSEPASFSDVAATAALGLGEVHEVPYNPAVLALPDAARRLAVLDWLQDNLLQLAAALSWDTAPLTAAYEACRRDNCELRQSGTPKAGPDRRYRAHVEFEIDGHGDGWSWVVVTDRAGEVVACSERRDSPTTLTASGRVRRSLRWQDDQVTWAPWVDDVAPPPRKDRWWIAHVARLSFTDAIATEGPFLGPYGTAAQAQRIRCLVANNGGIQVRVENSSAQQVTGLRLVDVVGEEPTWTWRLAPSDVGGRLLWDVLEVGDEKSFFLEFVDSAGETRASNGGGYAITVRFTDARGRRWERVGGGDPRQVPADDSDLM